MSGEIDALVFITPARAVIPDYRAAVKRYLIAYGFTGEPTPPVIGSAGATNINS